MTYCEGGEGNGTISGTLGCHYRCWHKRLNSTLVYADFVSSDALRRPFDQFGGPDHASTLQQDRERSGLVQDEDAL